MTYWETPPAPDYVFNEIFDEGDANIIVNDLAVLEGAIGIYGAVGARFVDTGGALPTAGDAVQWLVQTQGYNAFDLSTGGYWDTTGPWSMALTFPVAFPSGGGVAYIDAAMRYASDGSHGLTYYPNKQIFIVDDSVNLSGFSVGVFDVNDNTSAGIQTAGNWSCSYFAVGWVKLS